MAEALGHHAGGIAGLLSLLDEHQEAVEYDLIAHGLRLRDLPSPEFTWRDLLVLVSQAPRDSALVREIQGEQQVWGLTEHLLAAAVDALRVANWQRTKDAEKGKNPPEPIPRPGVEQPKQYGANAVSIEEMRERLDRKRHLAAVADSTEMQA